MDIFIRYLHFLSILTIAASLVGEFLFLDKKVSRKIILKLSWIDAAYGISSITLLISGFLLWFKYGKGEAFYTGNFLFHVKVTLAVLLGILSLPPTIYFLKNRKGEPEEQVSIPRYVKVCLQMELGILILLPLCAVLMAKGYGFIG